MHCIPLFQRIIILLVAFSNLTTAHAQLNISANQSAFALAQKLTGSGVVITNATLNCATGANGTFSVISSNLGIDSGIVLSTGLVLNINEQEQGLTSTNNNRAGDPDLINLSGASTTRDACMLEFDMVPQGNKVKFDYVFGSEEYINAVCGPYNDAFAFFISGPGIVGTKNIAQVPGTNIPVTVNSINNGIPGSQSNGTLTNCTQMGAGSPFIQYYINNQGGSTIAYRGFTQVFIAQHEVTPCATYHLKITIADAQNALYDSGVFLKAGSLKSPSIAVQAQGFAISNDGKSMIAKGCNAGSLTFSREEALPTVQTIYFSTTGTANAGIDFATLPISVTIPANSLSVTIPVQALANAPLGMRNLKVYAYAPENCNNTPQIADSAELLIIDAPWVNILTPDTTVCEGTIFQLRTLGQPNLKYQWIPNVGIESDTIATPTVTATSNTKYKMMATLPNSGCTSAMDSITINTIKGPEQVKAGDSIFTCIGYPINFSAEVLPLNAQFNYQWHGPNNFYATDKNAGIENPFISHTGWYTLTASIEECANKMDSVFVKVVEQVPLPIVNSPIALCINEEKILEANGRNLQWFYFENEPNGNTEAPLVNTATEGVQYFWVNQNYGLCASDKTKIEVHIIKCCTGIFPIPTAFSPNNDGLNDVFKIPMDNDTQLKTLQIFNRWGQKVYAKTFGEPSWDGTCKGLPADVGIYYFTIEFTCKDGKTFVQQGNLTLLR